MALDDLRYDIIAIDRFTGTYNKLERSTRSVGRELDTLNRKGRDLGRGGLGRGLADIRVNALAAAAAVGGVVIAVDRFLQLDTRVRRTRAAFTLLAGSTEEAAARMLAVSRASGAVLSSLESMDVATRASVLGLASTAQELERVVRFATITSRVLGIDTAGAVNNLAVAVGNLSFVRLDQMGISAANVRERMADMNQEIDASERFLEAVLQEGEATFGALEGSILTAASGLEVFNSGLDAMQGKLRELQVTQDFDNFLRRAGVALGGGITADLVALLETRLERLASPAGTAAQTLTERIGLSQGAEDEARSIERLINLLGGLDDAVISGVPGAQRYRDILGEVGRAALAGPLSSEQLDKLALVAEFWDLVGDASVRAAQNITAAGDALNRVTPGVRALQVLGGLVDPDQLTGAERRRVGAPDPMFVSPTGGPRIGDILVEQRRAEAELREQEARENERLIRRQESAWQRSVDRMASTFENALRNVPGLFGASPVTGQQLELAAAGVPQSFADDFRRRANDLLINSVPWPNISREFIEQLVSQAENIPIESLQGISGQLLANLFNEAFASGRVFGTQLGQQNLESLINFDAVQAELERQGRGEAGQAFLREALKGRGLEEAFTQAGGFADVFSQQMQLAGNQGVNVLATTLTNEQALAGIQASGRTLADGLSNALISNITDTNLGTALFGLIFGQFLEAASDAGEVQ